MSVKIAECRYGRQLYFDTDVYFAPMLETYGEYNYGETDLFQQMIREGDVVVDVGANIGCHTMTFAKIVGPSGMVLAFEPQKPVYNLLCGTVGLNEQWHVNTYPYALGAERGMTKVPFVQYDKPSSFGGVSVGGLVGHDVPVVPLDDFDLPRLTFIKIDVEGYEREVLLGAKAQIARHRPILYVENDRKEKSAELIALMLSYDYSLYIHPATMYHPHNFKECHTDIFPGVCAVMLLGVPAEMPIGEINLPPIYEPGDMLEFVPHKFVKDDVKHV